jgi:hypothetical protein
VPNGEMRRPPQLWEQRLARVTSTLGVGISSGDATAVVPPEAPPGSGGGTEPAPVLPPPGAFIKPSTPTLVGGLQGINVLWDGLNSASELWPYDTSWVEVHASTAGTAFTPGTATLKGRLARPGALFVGGLSAGTAYYFRLRGADPAGNYTEASDAATGYTGLTTASDYGTATIGSGAVSFNARQIGGVTNTVSSTAPSSPLLNDVWLDSSPGTAIIHKIWNGSTWVTNAWGSASIAAGQITALQIAAGAVTAGAISAGAVTTDKLTAGTISGFYISGGTIAGGYISGGTVSAGYITGGTINGTKIQTDSAGARVVLADGGRAAYLDIYSANSAQHSIYGDLGDLIISPSSRLKVGTSVQIQGDLSFVGGGNGDITATSLDTTGAVDVGGAFTTADSTSGAGLRVASDGKVYSYGIDDNTTANAANVRVGASAQLLKSTSTQRVKTNMAPLADTLPGVDPAKLATDPASVDPYDVLAVVPTEFESLAPSDNSQRILGFIAENVAEVFPWAAEWDAEGLPSSVADRPILAALLAVVRDQHNTITDLRTRIEALEA